MPYELVFGPVFTRGIKALKKRFPSVKRDVELAIEILLENPAIGVVIPGTSGVRKLRVRNSDLSQGKRKNRDRQILIDIPPQPNLQHARPFTPPSQKSHIHPAVPAWAV